MTSTTYRIAVRRLGAARAVSIAGSEAAYLALVALVFHETGSPYWVSAAVLAMVGCSTLAGPLAGALGDRFDRRRVMIVSDLSAAVAFVALALVHEPWLLVVVAGIAAVLESPFVPASQAAIPNLVPSEELAWANATVSSSRTIGQLAGPLLGGVLVAAAGAPLAFILNAVSFVGSALLVATVRGRFAAEGRDHREHGGMSAGFAWIRRDRVLRVMTIAHAILLFGVGPVLVAERPLAGVFGVGDVGYGLLIACWGGGVILGSQLTKRALLSFGEQRLLVLGGLGMGAGLGLTGVAPTFALALAGMVAGGVANGLFSVAAEMLVQTRTPDGVRSRAIAARQTIVMGAFTLSLAAGGPIVAWLGPQPVYAVAAAGCVGSAAMLLTLPVETRQTAPATTPA